MSIYAYKITRDYGFAPNPFGDYCTLACCKPHIRKKAIVGDWIIGTGAIENHLLYHLIFLMRVTEKMTFEEYWNDARFKRKKTCSEWEFETDSWRQHLLQGERKLVSDGFTPQFS